MPARRIYVDLDDVLAETARMFLRVLERDFGRRVAFDDLHSFHLGESLSLDEPELADFMDAIHHPAELAAIDPKPHAVVALAGWAELGYEIFVVTGRPRETRAASIAWLERHGVAFTEFHFLDKYSTTYDAVRADPEGALTLADLAELDFLLAVEDFAGIAPRLATEMGIPVALLDRPWNRHLESTDDRQGDDRGDASVVRCLDWLEIRRRFAQP